MLRPLHAIRFHFFFFSDRDFIQSGEYWPIGILDTLGRPKPIRQDLGMGARTLNMQCSNGQFNVVQPGATFSKALPELLPAIQLPGHINQLIAAPVCLPAISV